jgi:ribose transport system substrate-binding protein
MKPGTIFAPPKTLAGRLMLNLRFRSDTHIACLLALICCSGCHRFSSSRVISVIPRQASQSLWVTEHVGVNEAALRDHVNIYWNGPTEDGDVEQQIVLADRAISNGDFGLILSPNNPFALNTVVQRSLAAGMSVAIVGNSLSMKPEKRLSFVLNDEEEAGKLTAKRIESVLKGRGEVLIIGIDPVPYGSPDLPSAFEAVLSRDNPGIRIVGRLKGSFSFGQAEMAAEKAILENSHLGAILALNTTATRGTVAAVRTTHSSGRIKIIGCDHTLDVLFMLRQGMIDSLIVQNMRSMGAIAVDEIVAEDRGGTVPPYTYVEPVLITRENIDDDAIQRMLYMDWRVRP